MEAKLIFGVGTLTPAGQFLEFDPIQNSWSPRTLSPLGTRYNATSFVIGSKAYVGLGNDNNNNPLDDFWSFDPATDQWTPEPDFPFGTTSALGFSWSGSGYVITRAATSNFWKYDPEADSWSALPDFEGNNTPPGNIPHVLDAAFVLGDKLYALAVDYTTGPEEFYVFDFVSGQWTRLADVGTPFVSYGLTGFSALGAGYLHGAIGVIKYEPGTDTWISVANSLGGTNAKAFVIDDTSCTGRSSPHRQERMRSRVGSESNPK